jgi:anti-sigma factor RsiW
MPSPYLPRTREHDETSPRARDLANRLKQEIDNFASQHPGTSPEDIRTAGMLAMGGGGGRPPEARRAVAGVLAGLLVAGVLAAVLVARGAAGEGGTGQPFPVVAVAVVVALAGVLVVLKARWRD